MSHPSNISLEDLYYDPLYLSQDSQIAYMMSFEDNTLSEKAIHFSPKDIYESPLQSYNFVDFTKEAYEKLYAHTQEELRARSHDIAKAIRGGFKEYFLRSATKTLSACLQTINTQFIGQYGMPMFYKDYEFNKAAIAQQVKSDFRLEALKGNVPSKWPDTVHDFMIDLNELPITGFASEAAHIIQQFLTRVQNAITGTLKLGQVSLNEIGEMCRAMLGIAFRTANYSVILETLNYFMTLERDLTAEQNSHITSTVFKQAEYLLRRVFELPLKPRMQYIHSLTDMGGFGIMKKLHFQKQNYYYNSLTTDGQYLYLYISSVNGGMFKIGTGENSVAGKVYLHSPINKNQEVCWVYLKGKLYLRCSSKEMKNLDIIDPETFKIDGSIQLHCPSLFGHQIIQNINKNNPILTDGQHLYIVGKRLTTEKLPDPVKAEPEEKSPDKQKTVSVIPNEKKQSTQPVSPTHPPAAAEETQKDKEKKKKLIKKKEKKKGQEESQNILKIIEYVLFEFDVTSSTNNQVSEYENDSDLVKELYDSFSNYFTINECRKALNINKDDLAGAAQWLVDEGEKQRTKRTHTFTRSVVLAQAEVINEAHQKPLKSANEIQTKEDSILYAQHVSEYIWTCTKDQVACYTQSGIKVFSKHEKDYKPIHTKDDPASEDRKYRLHGTYLGTVECDKFVDKNRRFNKTPEYLIAYDNFQHKYYTFNWVNAEHCFPALITVSRDYSHYQEQITKEHQQLVCDKQPETLTELVAYTLNRLIGMEDRRFEMETRPSNWLYTYYCIVNEINQKIKNVKPEEAELKKKLINKRNKAVAKMNKILELSGAYGREKDQLKECTKAVREVKLDSIYCLNGRIQTLKNLDKMFHNRPEHQRLYFTLLDLWVLNADQIIFYDLEYLSDLGQRLFERLKNLKQGKEYDELLAALIKGFYIFYPKQEQQYNFLLALLKIEFVDLVDVHFRPLSNKKILFQSFIEELKAEQIADHYENSTEFEKFFTNNYFNTCHSMQVNDIGNLLLDSMEHPKDYKPQQLSDVSYVRSMVSGNKVLKEQLLDKITRGLQEDSEEMYLFYRSLLIKAIRYIKEFHNQKFENIQLPALLVDTLKAIEQSLSKLPYKSHTSVLKLASLVTQAYMASPVSMCPPQQVISAVNSLLQSMMRPDLVPLLNSIHLYKLEGVSQTLEKIYETNHPYDRDRRQQFEPQIYLQSIFIAVEFDKRCQSDANHDYLSIYSWSQAQPSREVTTNCDPFNLSLKMSGKVNSKKPYLMLGSSVGMQFFSSGNTRNEHSLNRYGFRFGIRPAYSGKIEYQRADLTEVINRFGSQEAFEQYVWMLKLLTVTSSMAVENNLIENKVSSESQLSSYLQGRIFVQGMEQENLTRMQSNISDERLTIVNNFMKNDSKDKFSSTVKELFETNKVRSAEETEAVPPTKNDELWNLFGIPSHIKPYIQQIKNYKGNFINLFLEARSHVKDLRVYTVEAMRKTFTEEYKKMWMMGEALLFLTVLKHSGLLQLSLDFSIEYIKQNLQAFEEARNGIINFFISRMQIARIWQDLVNTYHKQEQTPEQVQKEVEKVVEKQKKDKNVTIKKAGKKITVKVQRNKPKKEQEVVAAPKEALKKIKFNPQVTIRELLTDPAKVKQICIFKRIPYNEDDNYANASEIINRLQQEKITNESVYEEPAVHLIKSCLFLLRLKSNNNREQLHANIKPPEVYRSISDGTDQRRIDKNKVVVFREWLENWKKWKGFKKQEKVQLKFPVKEIVDFINGWMDNNEMCEVIFQRHKRVLKRIEMINQLNSLTKTVQGTLLEKYVLGTVSANLMNGLTYKIEGTSESLRNTLEHAHADYQAILRSISQLREKKWPVTLANFQSQFQKQSYVYLRIKSQAVNNLLLYNDMDMPPIDNALFYLSFRQMSNTNDELIQLSNRIVYKSLLTQHPIEELIRAMWRELGRDTISMRRWKDVVFIERILFLLFKVESKVRMTHLEIDQKEQLATVLFYVVYHIQAPLVSKIALRLIRTLELSKTRAISTPFDVQYLNLTLKPIESPSRNKNASRGVIVKPYKHELKNPLTNWQILNQRCGENFFLVREPVKASLLPKSEPDKKHHIILHLTSEEELGWLVNVLYYLEQLNPTMKKIGSYQQYLAEKAKKQESKSEKKQQVQPQPAPTQPPVALQSQRIEEKLLINIPEFVTLERELQDKLPIGWFLSYNNSFHDLKTNKLDTYKKSALKPLPVPANRKGTPNQRRNWQSPVLLKLIKKYEEISNKPLEEPKEADPQDEKDEFVKAKNFIARMRKHTLEAFNIMTQLMNNGYAYFLESDDPEKTEIICQLIEFGKQNRLHPIPCEFTKKDYKTKLAPGDIVAVDGTSELKIEFVQASFYPTLQYMLDVAQTTIKENNYIETNRAEMVFRDNQQMAWEEMPGGVEAEDGLALLGKELIESSWFRQMKKLHQVVIKDFEQPEYSIVQGGLESGIKKCTIISNNDVTLTSQSIEQDNIAAKPKEKIIINRDEILESLQKVLARPLAKIDSIESCEVHFELKCILSKAANADWTFCDDKEQVKELAAKLTELIKRTPTKKTVKQYQQQLQKLMIRLREKNVDALEVVSFYDRVNQINPKVERFLLTPTQKKESNDLQDKIEAIQTHFLPPSTYLAMIDTLPPQIEENKLLKYWDKNILPRIEEFVKSSFKPLEIEQYFEQMRIPLRKHDQVQAIKVAYVLCENKLPPGAVLLDANHDWESLTIEEATVGRYALLKLPKSVTQSSTPILRARGSEELSLIQIVFVDVKTNNLLVRRRMETHSIIHYFWVNLTSVLPVQVLIPKMTLQEIYRTTQDCLNGVICGYSKQLLSKLSEIVDVDSVGLIRENIQDRFVNDPVSGWLNDNKQWSLQPLIERMLKESNHSIIDMIEKELKSFKAYETDLFSDQLKKLNLFDSATSLIVSFKRTSKLSICSGVKFYNDELAMNQIAHVYTAKNERSSFEPVILREPNIYSKYYSNMQNLPQFEQTDTPSKIDVTVYGVEPIWTIACFLAEKIGQIAHNNSDYLGVLSRLNKIFINWIVCPGCYALRSFAATVIIRLTNRIVHIAKRNGLPVTLEILGVTKEKLDRIGNITKEINEEESKDLVALYSTFLQKLSEMLANLIAPLNPQPKIQAPPYIKSLIDVGILSRYILRNSGKWGDVLPLEIPEIPQEPNPQWERFMLVENLPLALTASEVRNKVISIIGENKGRILAPALDVYYEEGKLIALVDGWDVLELVQEDVIQKMQIEEEKEPEEQQALMLPWNCTFCTYENQAGADVCEMCQTPVPAEKPKEVFQKIESADLAAAQRKLREKQAKRFEAVKQKIKQYVNLYWHAQIDKIKVENNSINEKIKQRAQELKKRQEKQQKKKKKKVTKEEQKEDELTLLPVPEIQPCKITTGSQVLSNPLLENFLKRRLEPTPDIKNISNILKECDQGITNLEKFKFLETKGYDLWGVNVFDPQASLLPYDLLLLLMRYVQTEICKETSSVLSYNPNSIRLISQCQNMKNSTSEKPINFSVQNQPGIQIKYKRLTECKPYNIKYSWAVIKAFNNHLSQSMPYISLDRCRQSAFDKSKSSRLNIKCTIGQEVCAIRELIMCSIKSQLSQKITQRTSTLRDMVPKIVLERLKIKEGERKNIVSAKQKDQFFLSRAYEQLKLISPTQLRPFKPKGTESYLAFEVTFKGENVQGQTGPYRQFFTDLSNELHPSKNMGLLIVTPNNKHNTGQARSKYMINPSANNSYQLNLFEFIGLLMGCSIRTGAHLALDMPSMLWRQVVGQDITYSDLEEIDCQFYEFTKQILQCPNEETFSEIDEVSGEPLFWVGTLSDSSEIELIPKGRTIRVEYKQRFKFVSKLIQARIKENLAQIKSLRKGISQMVPESYLNCLSGQDLEIMVCGRPKVDVDLLKKHTKYSGNLNESSRRIQFFWNILRDMTEQDRLKFIKFCWGQERLPVNSEEFERNNIRFMIKPSMNDSGPADKLLPRADTCFFNIELPDYSTEAIMRERIMLAINTDSDSMNAEELHEEHAMMGVESSFDEGDYEEGADGGREE